MVGQHEAHVEHRHQRLAAGQKLGVVERAQEADRLGKGFRIVILKGWRFHRGPDEGSGEYRKPPHREQPPMRVMRAAPWFCPARPVALPAATERRRRLRRRLLSRPQRHPDRRLQRRRRLRQLLPHPGAASRQAHSGQSGHRGAEHAGRGLAASSPTISTTPRRRTARRSACSPAAWRWSR